jgi:lipopolysaccharide transport system permease protein
MTVAPQPEVHGADKCGRYPWPVAVEQNLPVEHRTSVPIRRIQPATGLFRIDPSELWRFREIELFLIWRDVKSRYRQTVLGGTWAILRPLLSTVVFTVIFGGVAKIKPGGGLPYALFVLPGVVLWTYFSSAISGGASSVVGNGALVTKAYFPRVHLVLAAVLAPIIDFTLSLLVVVGVFSWYHHVPNWHVVLLPVFLALTVVFVLGLSLWLAPFTVRYRDVPFALPFVLQIWMFLTPIVYPTSIVPARFHWLLSINPFTALAAGGRWSLVGGAPPGAAALATSIGLSVALILGGLVYFRRREPSFPDYL